MIFLSLVQNLEHLGEVAVDHRNAAEKGEDLASGKLLGVQNRLFKQNTETRKPTVETFSEIESYGDPRIKISARLAVP